MSRLFIFGIGYTGLVCARHMKELGWRVAGTVRSAEKAAALQSEGIEAVVFDGTGPSIDVIRLLAEADHVLVSVQPSGGDPVLAHHRGDLAAGKGRIQWIGYLSTVGVYGDREGGWVSEEDEPAPTTERSTERIKAEKAWLAFAAETETPVAVLRLAGIYGLGKNPLKTLKEGRARRIVRPGQVFNRIHVDDIARAVEACITRPRYGAVYNVTDDEPAPSQDVVTYAASLMKVAPPPEVPLAEAGLSPMGLSFYTECKRVKNAKIKAELDFQFSYPDYRAASTGSG